LRNCNNVESKSPSLLEIAHGIVVDELHGLGAAQSKCQ
jgi:hypothetical protein